MRIGILGTGTMAEALGGSWARAGHELVVGGRSQVKAKALAARLGGAARTAAPPDVATGCDAVLLAVLWSGVEDILRSAGANDGALAGMPLIDPTNAVEHGVGVLLTGSGGSAAHHISTLAPGAHVVKAFHLFPAEQWTAPVREPHPVTVPLCGDDPSALEITGELVRDTGAVPAVLGPLSRVRQLEEVAGFLIGLAFAGFDPNSAIPRVPSASPRAVADAQA